MWFYSRFSCIPFHCPHFHSGSLAWQEVSWILCQMQLCLFSPFLLLGPPGLIGCEWFHAKSSCIPSNHCSCSHFLLSWQAVSDFMLGAAVSHLTILTPTLILLAWQEVSDFMKFSYVPSHCPYSDSGLVGFSASKWFNARFSWVPSHCPHSHSGLIGFTVCEWFHVSFGWFSSYYPYSHFGHVGLIVCEWIHARFSCAPSHSHLCLIGLIVCEHSMPLAVSSYCPHSHSGTVGLTVSECPCLAWQQYLFLLFSFPLWFFFGSSAS